MLELFFVTVLIAIAAGLLTGILPGLGPSALMISSLPLLFTLPPELCIIFYAVAVQASQFSGSVSAINFGMMGELTSYPALVERNYILENNLQKTALKFTAIGSAVACIIPALALQPLLQWFQQQSFIMRTDFIFVVCLLILLFCLVLRKNHMLINFLLIIIGIFVSQIGLHGVGAAEREFLTFGQPFMYAGIPMIAMLGGLIAVPLIVQNMNWQATPAKQNFNNKNKRQVAHLTNFPLWSSLRGSVLGFLSGLIPVIGTQIGSYLAWYAEGKLKPRNQHNDTMSRLTAAESANNSGGIAVLIPLLILGIAIVPSEMILLGVLKTKYWQPGLESLTIAGAGFVPLLVVSLVACSIFCYLICYSFLHLINNWLRSNLRFINIAAILMLSIMVFYAGSLVEARSFFIACFVALSTVALVLKQIDFKPMVVGYFLGDLTINSAVILTFIYF